MQTDNSILDSVSAELRSQILSASKLVELPARTVLYSRESTPEAVYFLSGGIASVAVSMRDGISAEVGMIGREGLVGAVTLMSDKQMAADCFMDVAGHGYRLPSAVARDAFHRSIEFRGVVLHYLQKRIIVGQQFAACNRLHDAQSRLARWLLMVSDRLRSNEVPVTQEFLAGLLGTQRSTVALVAARLQSQNCITVRHGVVTVSDRSLLERQSCECYVIQREALYSKL